jgi:hypothetical protein
MLQASKQSYARGQGEQPAANLAEGYVRVPVNLADPNTGFNAEVYKNSQGDLIVAFTGTEGSALDARAGPVWLDRI